MNALTSVPATRTEAPDGIALVSSGLFCSPFGPVSPSPAASFGRDPVRPELDPEAGVVVDLVRADGVAARGIDHLDAVRAVECDPVLGGARAADRVPRARRSTIPRVRVRDRRDAVDVGADEVARDRVPVARPAPAGREHRDAAAVARDDVAADRVVVRVGELDPVETVAEVDLAGRVDAEEVALDRVAVRIQQDPAVPPAAEHEPADRGLAAGDEEARRTSSRGSGRRRTRSAGRRSPAASSRRGRSGR